MVFRELIATGKVTFLVNSNMTVTSYKFKNCKNLYQVMTNENNFISYKRLELTLGHISTDLADKQHFHTKP